MAVEKKKKGKSDKVLVVSPVGRINYPFLLKKDEGRKYSSGKFSIDLMFDKTRWFSKNDDEIKKGLTGKELRLAVLKVGRAHFKDAALQLADFANPFKDGDVKEDAGEHLKGQIIIRAKSEFKPLVFNAAKAEMTDEEIGKIKSGDFARAVYSIYPYTQGDGGVTCGLQYLQFQQVGPAIGGGRTAALALLSELEVDLGDMPADDEAPASDEDEDDAPKAKKAVKKTAKKAAKAEEDVDDESEDEDTDEETDVSDIRI